MGYKLCMAEKPSVARDIASVIGADKKCKGYYEGNGYRVTWAVGHLVGLAEPEEYGFVSKEAMWRDEKEKAYAELPIIPDNFKLVVLEQTEEQFGTDTPRRYGRDYKLRRYGSRGAYLTMVYPRKSGVYQKGTPFLCYLYDRGSNQTGYVSFATRGRICQYH